MPKEDYEETYIKIIRLDVMDIITASANTDNQNLEEGDTDDDNSGQYGDFF